MDWPLTTIRAETRTYTGRPSENQLSTENLDAAINHVYQNVLPLEIECEALRGWFEYNLSASEDEVTVDPDTYLVIRKPITIDGDPVDFYLNPSLFYGIWPESQTYTETQPTHILYYNHTLILRPPSDGVYPLKAATVLKPDALTEDGDKPLENIWGPLIAVDAAIKIFLDNGQKDEAKTLTDSLRVYYLARIFGKEVKQLEGQRSIPRF